MSVGMIPPHHDPAADLEALQTGAVPATNEYTLLIIAFEIHFAGNFLKTLCITDNIGFSRVLKILMALSWRFSWFI